MWESKTSKLLLFNIVYTLFSIALLIYLVGVIQEELGIFLYVILLSLGALLWLIYFIIAIWNEFKRNSGQKTFQKSKKSRKMK